MGKIRLTNRRGWETRHIAYRQKDRDTEIETERHIETERDTKTGLEKRDIYDETERDR